MKSFLPTALLLLAAAVAWEAVVRVQQVPLVQLEFAVQHVDPEKELRLLRRGEVRGRRLDTSTLRRLRDQPFALLLEMERLARGAAHGAEGEEDEREWVGIAFRVERTVLLTPRDDVREVLAVPDAAFADAAQRGAHQRAVVRRLHDDRRIPARRRRQKHVFRPDRTKPRARPSPCIQASYSSCTAH